jgi:hypothetical protein
VPAAEKRFCMRKKIAAMQRPLCRKFHQPQDFERFLGFVKKMRRHAFFPLAGAALPP